MNHLLTTTTLLLALAFPVPAPAVDMDERNSPPPATDALAPARDAIYAGRWAAALDELQRVNASSDADWQNLMGFVLRKRSPPDLAAAERHYNEALRLKPRHRGALEYSGELYLMKGDLPRAEQRLATLEKECGSYCGEYRDLKKAVERFKANRALP